MAFYIPALKDVVQRVRRSFQTELPGADAWLWPNNIYVTAKVIGGAVWELFGRLAWLDRQRFMFSADLDGLLLHGQEFKILRKPATYASGFIRTPALFPFIVPEGTTFERSDGIHYTSTAEISAKQFANVDYVLVPVTCDVVGKVGNCIHGTPFTTDLQLTTAGDIEADDDGLGQGADIEDVERYRERLLFRKRNPPMSGADYDYEAWAKEIPGVTRAYVKGSAFGRGTVGIWFMMDDTYTPGIPLPADVAAVQAHIDALKPSTAVAIVQAPQADCVDVTVKGLTPDTQSVREAAAAELHTLFLRETQPGMPDNPFVLNWSLLWQAVGNAAGEKSHTIIAPTSDLTFSAGRLACLRNVQFIK